jgi:hypothetical protein
MEFSGWHQKTEDKPNTTNEKEDNLVLIKFNEAKEVFERGRDTNDEELIDSAWKKFEKLIKKPRVDEMKTDSLKQVKIDSYYLIAEIEWHKRKAVPAMEKYAVVVEISETHYDSWFKLGEIWMHRDGPEFPDAKQKGIFTFYIFSFEVLFESMPCVRTERQVRNNKKTNWRLLFTRRSEKMQNASRYLPRKKPSLNRIPADKILPMHPSKVNLPKSSWNL